MSLTGTLSIWESGTLKANAGTYVAGDNLEVGVDNGIVTYYKNGAAIYTSLVTPTFPLFFNANISTTNALVYNAFLCGNTDPHPTRMQVSAG